MHDELLSIREFSNKSLQDIASYQNKVRTLEQTIEQHIQVQNQKDYKINSLSSQCAEYEANLEEQCTMLQGQLIAKEDLGKEKDALLS